MLTPRLHEVLGDGMCKGRREKLLERPHFSMDGGSARQIMMHMSVELLQFLYSPTLN